MNYLFFSLRNSGATETETDSFMYGCPLSLVPGSHFGGSVQIFGPLLSGHTTRTFRIDFDIDTIADFVDNEDCCTCSEDEMNCDCDFIALSYLFRADVHNAFVHLNDLLPESALIHVIIRAGALKRSFDTMNKHKYDCYCDSFRNQIDMVPTSFDPFEIFLEKKTTDV